MFTHKILIMQSLLSYAKVSLGHLKSIMYPGAKILYLRFHNCRGAVN